MQFFCFCLFIFLVPVSVLAQIQLTAAVNVTGESAQNRNIQSYMVNKLTAAKMQIDAEAPVFKIDVLIAKTQAGYALSTIVSYKADCKTESHPRVGLCYVVDWHFLRTAASDARLKIVSEKIIDDFLAEVAGDLQKIKAPGASEDYITNYVKSHSPAKDEWKLMGFYEVGSVRVFQAINLSKVTRDGSRVEFWVKERPTSRTKEFFDQWLVDTDKSTRLLDQYDYRMTFLTGDCRTLRLSLVKLIDYWKDGTTDSADLPVEKEALPPPAPDSAGEKILQEVCKP